MPPAKPLDVRSGDPAGGDGAWKTPSSSDYRQREAGSPNRSRGDVPCCLGRAPSGGFSLLGSGIALLAKFVPTDLAIGGHSNRAAITFGNLGAGNTIGSDAPRAPLAITITGQRLRREPGSPMTGGWRAVVALGRGLPLAMEREILMASKPHAPHNSIALTKLRAYRSN